MSRPFLHRMGAAIAVFFGAILAIASPAAASSPSYGFDSTAVGYSNAPAVAAITAPSGSVNSFVGRSASDHVLLMTIATRGDQVRPDNPNLALATALLDRGGESMTTIGLTSIAGADVHNDGSGAIAA